MADPASKTTACPRCDAPVKHMPGIGEFCPNLKCDALDDLRPDWLDRPPSEAEMFFKRLREIVRTNEDEWMSDTTKGWNYRLTIFRKDGRLAVAIDLTDKQAAAIRASLKPNPKDPELMVGEYIVPDVYIGAVTNG